MAAKRAYIGMRKTQTWIALGRRFRRVVATVTALGLAAAPLAAAPGRSVSPEKSKIPWGSPAGAAEAWRVLSYNPEIQANWSRLSPHAQEAFLFEALTFQRVIDSPNDRVVSQWLRHDWAKEAVKLFGTEAGAKLKARKGRIRPSAQQPDHESCRDDSGTAGLMLAGERNCKASATSAALPALIVVAPPVWNALAALGAALAAAAAAVAADMSRSRSPSVPDSPRRVDTGRCTQDEHRKLQFMVEALCKSGSDDTCHGPGNGQMHCTALGQIQERNQAVLKNTQDCLRARQRIRQRCYPQPRPDLPRDPEFRGHRLREHKMWKRSMKCDRIIPLVESHMRRLSCVQ